MALHRAATFAAQRFAYNTPHESTTQADAAGGEGKAGVACAGDRPGLRGAPCRVDTAGPGAEAADRRALGQARLRVITRGAAVDVVGVLLHGPNQTSKGEFPMRFATRPRPFEKNSDWRAARPVPMQQMTRQPDDRLDLQAVPWSYHPRPRGLLGRKHTSDADGGERKAQRLEELRKAIV